MCRSKFVLHDGIPIFICELNGGHSLGTAGTVDEDLHTSEGVAGGLEQMLDARIVRHVAGGGERFPSQRFDHRCSGSNLLLATPRRHHICSRLRKTSAKGEPDSAGPADDNCCFIFQFEEWMSMESSLWKVCQSLEIAFPAHGRFYKVFTHE